MPLRFSYGKLSFEDVRTFLLETDNEFLTPLSMHINIDAYARKLSDFSEFSICRYSDSIVGMISCYTNRPPLGYISNVCVKRQYQGKKIFSRLFHHLLTGLKDRGISFLQLEVNLNNNHARHVYEHFGFYEKEIRPSSGKVLMEFRID